MFCKPKRRVGCHAGLFCGQPLDAGARHIQQSCKGACAHVERSKVFLAKDFTGVDRDKNAHHLASPVSPTIGLTVINNLDILGAAIAPNKANTPFVVYANGVLPFSLAFKCL